MSTVDRFIEGEHIADPAPDGKYKLLRMSSVEPCEPEFIWYPYVRRATTNDFRGDGGSGKTTLALAFAGAVSNGAKPPGMPGVLNLDGPRTVIYLGSEDELPVYRDKLDKQGANADNILMLDGLLPTLGEMDALRGMIREYEAALLIIDPIQAFLPPCTDMNKASEVRPVMDGLRAVCRETGCTALILEHLNKATKADNIYRGSGSMDFYNASRSVMMTGWTEQGQRACGHLKSNGGPPAPAILFDIAADGRLVWKGTDSAISGSDVLSTRPKLALALPEIGSAEDRAKYEASDVARAMRAFCAQVQDGDEQRVSYREFNDWCAERGFRVVGGAQSIHREIDRCASRLIEYDGITVAFDKRVGSGKGMWITRKGGRT